MKEGRFLGGLLTNSETWTKISKKDIDYLEEPDNNLRKSLVSAWKSE